MPVLFRQPNIPVLSPLVAAAEQNGHGQPALAEINSVAWAIIHAQFGHALAHRLAVTQIAPSHPPQAGKNAGHRVLIPQVVQLLIERHTTFASAKSDDFFGRALPNCV